MMVRLGESDGGQPEVGVGESAPTVGVKHWRLWSRLPRRRGWEPAPTLTVLRAPRTSRSAIGGHGWGPEIRQAATALRLLPHGWPMPEARLRSCPWILCAASTAAQVSSCCLR